jgi:hypothetical protein
MEGRFGEQKKKGITCGFEGHLRTGFFAGLVDRRGVRAKGEKPV